MARDRPSRASIHARLDAALAQLHDNLGGLPTRRQAAYVWDGIRHEEAHHSTALEGNTLVLREVEHLLDSNRALGAKTLTEYAEAKGYGAAATWVYGQAREPGEWSAGQLITMTEIRRIHHELMAPVWAFDPHPDATEREAPGSFREHDIHPFEQGMTPPSWPLVPAELAAWVDDVNSGVLERGDGPLPERLAKMHNDFERIHPFVDRNGRTGRLVMNLLLVRLDHPPVIILKKQRDRCLDAMGKADVGDHDPLGELLARAMIDNLNRFILPSIAGPAKLVPLAALSDMALSVAALRLAASKGRLDAEKRSDGQWLSSRAAVETYKASRKHAGRQPLE